jgi:hypothetical protein
MHKSRRARVRVARNLRNLLDEAEHPSRGIGCAVPVQRGQVLAERDLLKQLADALDSEDELSPRGILLVRRLLTDGASPVYAPTPNGALHDALTDASAALYLR